MAFLKSLVIRSGHVCTYWRITAIERNFAIQSGVVEISGYRDQQAREEGLPPASDAVLRYSGYIGHGGTEEAYGWLKGLQQTVPGRHEPNPAYTGPEGTEPPTIYIPETVEPGPFADAEDV